LIIKQCKFNVHVAQLTSDTISSFTLLEGAVSDAQYNDKKALPLL